MFRFRIKFAKNEVLRFIGHLDLFRCWERAFRRAKLPLEYSQGFNPRPRLNLASALPLGITSQGEILDTWLSKQIPVMEIKKALDKGLPPGIQIIEVTEVDLGLPSLQSQVTSAEFMAKLLAYVPDLDERIQNLMSAQSVPRQRRGKPYDLRPLIDNLSWLEKRDETEQCLFMRLLARESATGRPEEVLSALNIPPEMARISRTKLILSTGDTFRQGDN